MEIKEQTFKNFFFVAITEVFGYLSNFLIIYLLTFSYPPEEFVYYPFAMSILIFFLIFANFGIEKTSIRFLAGIQDTNLKEISKLISEGFKIIFMFTLFTSIIMFFISNFLESLYKMPGLGLVLKYTALYLMFSNLINYFESSFQGLFKFKLYAFSNITFNLLKLIIVYYYSFSKIPIYKIVASYSIVALLQFIFLLIFIQIKYGVVSYVFKKDIKLTKNILGFALYVFFPILFQFLITNFNLFILAYYVNNKLLAYYLITLMFMLVLSMPIFIFTRLILPYISHYIPKIETEREKVQIVYNSIFKYGFLIIIPITVYFFFYSQYFVVFIFGNEYILIADFLRVYIFYLFVKIIDLGGESFLLASENQKTVFRLSGLTALFILILSLILIPYYYIYGAIISIIVPHFLYVIYSNYLVKKKNKIKFSSKIVPLLLKYLVCSLITIIIIQIIIFISAFDINLPFKFIIFTATYVGLFITLSFCFKAIKIKDIKKFAKIIIKI